MAADKRESPAAPGQPAGSKPTAQTTTDEAASLRRRAEDAVRSLATEAGEEPTPGDARDLLHELSVHQVELEMQNDELRRTQEKLDATLARYLELYDFAPVGYLTISEDGLLLEANLTAMQLFGASAGDLDSQPLSRFVLREDQDVFYRHHREVFAVQEPRVIELRLVHNDGTPFWARLHSVAARPKKGEAPFCRTVISDVTERRRSEREKEQSERRLRDAMDAACLISWEWEPATGRVIWAGRLDDGTAPGSSGVVDDPEAIRRLVLADDLGDLIATRDAARDGGTGFEHETRVEFPDGSTRWLSVRGAYKYDPDGSPVRARGITQDVSTRKLAETELAESETRYRELVENLNEMIYAIGLDGTVTYVSPAVTTILGYQPEDLVGTPFTGIVHSDDVEAIRDAFQSVLEGDLKPRQYRLLDTRGEPHWVQTSSRPLIKEGVTVGLQGVLTDITENRRAQEALASSELNILETIENVHLIALDLDRNGQIRFINEFGLRIAGWSREEVFGRNWFDMFLPVDQREELRGLYLHTVVTGEFPPHFDNAIVTRDGEERAIHWSNTAQRDPAGRVVGIFSLGEDITERKRAEVERERLLAKVRGLAARLAEVEEAERKDLARELHDRIGQNLTALGLNLSVLRNRLSPTYLTKIHSILDDSALLVVETMDQVRHVMTELHPPMLDDYGLVAALEWFAGVFSQRSGVTVTVSGSEPAPRLASQTEIAIFRIVQEALTNVGKHAGAGAVEISVAEVAGAIRVTVADDGCGYAAAAPPTSDRPEGWGLAIMKERAELIGGALLVASEPGGGTRIVVEIGGRPA